MRTYFLLEILCLAEPEPEAEDVFEVEAPVLFTGVANEASRVKSREEEVRVRDVVHP